MASLRRALQLCGALAPLVGLGLGACSSGEKGGSSSSSAEFAARFCALFKPCCAAAGFPDSDQQVCRFLYGSVPVLDQAAAEQCLDQYQALAKQPTFCDLNQADAPEPCQRAFPQNGPGSGGTKKPGEPCEWGANDDCAGDATCDTEAGAKTGKCAQFVIVGEGAACRGVRKSNGSSWSGEAVNNQLPLCDGDANHYCSNSGVCKKKSPVGESCDGFSGCLPEGHCQNSVCVAKLATGSPCPNFSDECNDLAFCADSSKVCEPRREDGKSCQQGEECLSDYCDEGSCKKDPGVGGLVLSLFCS